MNPNYVTGLIQADGSFFVALEKRAKSRFALRLRPKFTLTLDISSQNALEATQSFFNKVGRIHVNTRKRSAELVVDSLSQLVDTIIPHFQQYPLQGSKQQSFEKRSGGRRVCIVKSIHSDPNYNKQVLVNIIQSAFAMNRCTNRSRAKLQALYSYIQHQNYKWPQPLPPSVDYPLQDEFIAGLIDGDGCFSVSFLAHKRLLFGFHITGDATNIDLFKRIQQKLRCGSVKLKSKSFCRYQVDGLADIQQFIIPFMQQFKLYTQKAIHFQKFEQIARLVCGKAHHTDKGFLHIMDIGYNMNCEGKRRKLTKQQYIDKYLT